MGSTISSKRNGIRYSKPYSSIAPATLSQLSTSADGVEGQGLRRVHPLSRLS
jgi:hypothetical protein